jgi:mannose-6-phosphate isomerase
MWMGTHSSNPSYDYETKRSLEDFIKDNQMLMGNDVVKKYGEKLPFLFKVLSAQKALSIQAHPNKKLAKELHEKNPKEYKDDNHKPEMTIAITPFEGLCGFRPLKEVSYFLKAVKSFRELVGEDAAAQFEATVDDSSKSEAELKQALKDAFSSLMNAKEEDIKTAAEELLAQIKKEDQGFAGGESTPTPGSKAFAELLPRLNSQFPNDIGLFVTFFLNYVKLQPGEAMFLQADDIHAYISGGTFPENPTFPLAKLTTTTQISWNAWPPPTTSSAPASRPNSKTSPPSPACSPTTSRPSPSKKCPPPTSPTANSTPPPTAPTPARSSTTLRSKNSPS